MLPTLMTRHTDRHACAQLSADGTRALSFAGGTAMLWDTASGEEIVRYTGARRVRSISLSPDGRHAALAYESAFMPPGGLPPGDLVLEEKVFIWDSATGKETPCQQRTGSLQDFGWSPDGTLLVSAGFDSHSPVKTTWHVEVFDTDGASVFRDELTGAETNSVQMVIMCGSTLVIVHYRAVSLLLHSKTGTAHADWQRAGTFPVPEIHLLGHDAALSADGAFLLLRGTAPYGTAQRPEYDNLLLWDVGERRTRRVLAQTGLQRGGDLAWSPDGRRIAYSDTLDKAPLVWVVDVDDQACCQMIQDVNGSVNCLSWHGNRLYIGTNKEIAVWEV